MINENGTEQNENGTAERHASDVLGTKENGRDLSVLLENAKILRSQIQNARHSNFAMGEILERMAERLEQLESQIQPVPNSALQNLQNEL